MTNLEPYITDFLDTDTPKEELAIALKVIKEFLDSHNEIEKLSAQLLVWTKLNQLIEFLEHLVNGNDLEDDTIYYRDLVNAGKE